LTGPGHWSLGSTLGGSTVERVGGTSNTISPGSDELLG
jgi:hypothetical protein